MEFDSAGFEDLAWWVEQGRAHALRVIRLIRETQLDPFKGIGKPEPLRHELSGCWSRRIDQEHRLGYQVMPDKIRIWRAAITTERYGVALGEDHGIHASIRVTPTSTSWLLRQDCLGAFFNCRRTSPIPGQ